MKRRHILRCHIPGRTLLTPSDEITWRIEMVSTYNRDIGKPCPKCGRDPTLNDVQSADGIRYEYQLECKKCGIQTKFYIPHIDAVDEWNWLVYQIKRKEYVRKYGL